MRPVLLGLPRQSVRPSRLGSLDHGGGSQRAAAVGGFLVTGPGKILRARRARPPLGRRSENQFSKRDSWLVGALHTKAGAFSRPTNAPLSFLGIWDHSSRLQWGHNRCQTHAGNSPGNSGHTPPDLQALERGRRHFGARGGNPPRWCKSSLPKRPGCLVEGLQARDLPLSKGKSKVLIDGTDKLKQALLQQLEVLGIDECDTARNVGADLQLGRRRRALVVKGRLARAAKRTKRVRQLRKAGAHTRNLTLTARMQGCFGVPRFWASLRHSSNPSESTRPKPHMLAQPRTKTATTMLASRPGSLGQKTSIRHFDIIDKSFWAWGSVISSGRGVAPRTQGPPFVLTLLRLGWSAQSARHLTSHSGTKIDLLAVAPKTVRMWVDQASLLWSDSSAHWNQSKGPLFWEAIRPLLVSGKLDGVVTLASERAGPSWSREASGGKGLRGSGARTTAAASCATKDQAPCSTAATSAQPCRQKEICTFHRSCARRHVLWELDTGNSLHMAFFLTLAPFCQLVLQNVLARFCGTTGPQTGFWRGTFSRTAPRRAAVRCDVLAGQWWRSTMWGTSRRLRMGRYRATFCQGRPLEMARTSQQPWQGTSRWIRSLCTSTAKVPSRQSMGQSTKPWEPKAPEHTSGTGFWFPTTRSGRSRSRVMRHSATWRRGALPTCAKGETTLQTPSPRKEQTHTNPLFRVAKTVVACASLAKQAARWAAEAHVLLRSRGWNDTRAAAPRSRVRPPRLKRKRHMEIAAPTSGQVCDWLSPVVPTRFL